MKPPIHFIAACLFLLSCETATHEPQPLSGELIAHSSCNSSLKAASTADSLSCVEFSYDQSRSRLVLKHINAAFNCCPDSLYCLASLNKDTILVQEFQASNLCKCNCLYDLILEVKGVEAKAYFVRFIEPLKGSQQELAFKIDLAKDISGRFSAERKNYPWGGY